MFARWSVRVALALVLSAPATLSAQAPKVDISAKLVPGDVYAYSTSLRLREQFDILVKSEAYKQLMALDSVQNVWAGFQAGLDAGLEAAKADPDNADLLAMLAELASDEIFYAYGERGHAFFELYTTINNASRFGGLGEMLKGGGGGFGGPPNFGNASPRAMVQAIDRRRDLLKTPDLLVGFRVKNVERARKQVARLGDLLGVFVGNKASKVRIGREEFLVLSGTGDMVPWDDLIQPLEEKAGEFDALLKKLRGLKGAVSLGLSGEYLILAVDEGTGFAERFGPGPNRLIDRKEFRPLAKAEKERLTAVSYVRNAAPSAAEALPAEMLDALKGLADAVPAGVVSPKLRDKILASMQPKKADGPAVDIPQLDYSYLTKTGYESFSIQFGGVDPKAGDRPLRMLQHVGGAPLMAFVSRDTEGTKEYRELVEDVRELIAMADENAKSWPAERKEKYEASRKAFAPHGAKLDEILGKSLVPALVGGESALVVDAKWTSAEWLAGMPPANGRLPMIELGLSMSVADAALAEKGAKDLYAWVEAVYATTKKLYPKLELPDLAKPDIDFRAANGAKVWSMKLPSDLKLDAQVRPSAALSEKTATMALSSGHAERLLAPTPLQSEVPLAKFLEGRNLVSAGVCDWAGMVKAATPWVEYGLRRNAAQTGEDPEPTLVQVRAVAEVLQTFRGSAWMSYVEGDTLVTRSESVFRDLAPRR